MAPRVVRAKQLPVDELRPLRSPVAERIEQIREAKKITRPQLADRLKVARIQVWRIESGITEVSADTAAAYAKALGVPITELYRKPS